MITTLRTLPIVARFVFVVGLLCSVIFAQVADAHLPALACTVAGFSQEQTVALAVDCHDCCAAMPCCLLSKKASEVPAKPEPMSSERNSQLDHAPVAVTLTPIPTFDFLTSLPASRILARERQVQSARGNAPRVAVSCIWLI